MFVQTLADITGDGAAHPLVTDSKQAKWLQLLADPDNSGVIRVGGPDTSSTRGLPLIAGASMEYDPIAEPMMSFYPLANIYYYAENGDKLYAQYIVG